jgi:signal transduction histidine kinase/CheY-like chemotaxis protein
MTSINDWSFVRKKDKRVLVPLSIVYLVVLACALFVGFAGLSYVKSQLKQDQSKTLRAMVESASRSLVYDYAQLKAVALSWSEAGRIRTEIGNLHRAAQGSAISGSAKNSVNYLREQLAQTVRAHSYLGFFVLDEKRRLLASAKGLSGFARAVSNQASLLDRVFQGDVLVTHPLATRDGVEIKVEEGDAAFAPLVTVVGAPVRDDNGSVIAALCFMVDSKSLLSSSIESAQIGRSGETYIFDRSGTMLSVSRFVADLGRLGLGGEKADWLVPGVQLIDPGAELTTPDSSRLEGQDRPLTRMAASAVRGRRGVDTDGYRDYRGVYVVGAWNWIDEEDIGIATELDQREADLSYVRVLSVFWLAFILFVSTLTSALVLLVRQGIQSERLEEAVEVAKAAVVAKGYFLANVSHELRTPLTAIIGFAEILKDSKATIEDRRQAVKAILDNGKHLLSVVSDILDFSKMELGSIGIEQVSFSPADLVRDVHALLVPKAMQKEVLFTLNLAKDLPERITSDPVRLRQILLNLLGNALKFTEKGEVSIDVWCDWTTSQLHFRVVDTGIGMSSEQLMRIFRPFTQADLSTTRKYGGTGLGLSISKQLVEALGGNLTCSSVPQEGSVFTFWITAKSLEQKGITCIEHETSNPKMSALSGRILVAEDAVDLRGLIGMVLRPTGLNVCLVDNGKAAVDSVLGGGFDLVLLDIQMPVMDGYTAARILRENGVKIPIVAVSANVSPHDHVLCQQAGCTDLLAKPFTKDQLLSCLAKYLSADTPARTADGRL